MIVQADSTYPDPGLIYYSQSPYPLQANTYRQIHPHHLRIAALDHGRACARTGGAS